MEKLEKSIRLIIADYEHVVSWYSPLHFAGRLNFSFQGTRMKPSPAKCY